VAAVSCRAHYLGKKKVKSLLTWLKVLPCGEVQVLAVTALYAVHTSSSFQPEQSSIQKCRIHGVNTKCITKWQLAENRLMNPGLILILAN